MIDLISFYLPGGVSPELTNTMVGQEGSFRGSFKNMRVLQSSEGIYCTGSIAKYLQGENVTPLTRKSVKEALSNLEADTGWNLKQAELKQIEIGTTIPVENPSSYYLLSWGQVPRFKKHSIQNKMLETVMYRTGNRSFSGYDKRAEAKVIPTFYSDSDLLRLELKYKKGLKKYMKKILTPWDLTDKETYTDLVKRWQKFYFSIPKGRIPVLDFSEGTSPKDLDNALKLYAMQQLGDAYPGFINMLEQRGIFGRVQAGRARKSARDILQDTRISQPDNLAEELDAKVRSQIAYIR